MRVSTLCMARLLVLVELVLFTAPAWSFVATEDQCSVNVRYEDATRRVLLIEGQTYVLRLDCTASGLTAVSATGEPFIDGDELEFVVGEAAVEGPGRVNIYSFGTQMYEVHLRDLKATGVDGDIELALYCYGKRAFVNLNAVQRETRLALPGAIQYTGRPSGPYDAWTTVSGTCLVLVAGETVEETASLAHQERHPEEVSITCDGGRLEGYRPTRGFYEIMTLFSGPRSFETAWINPNARYEVKLRAELAPNASDATGREIVCNVRNNYGVLEAAVLTDIDGYPLPVQVQVGKNFAGENEEGPWEGDAPFGESYVPLTVSSDAPFEGCVYHLFGNWGTHPLKQISSIRFFHHYFHASLGPTETFCYVPFEYPRDDDRNYILADVRGLSNRTWPDQPQHDHVSVIGALRYKSEGRWVNNLLRDTRIYLTSPNLANFALDYSSEDGRIETTYEIFEIPQDDEARCYIKAVLNVKEAVPIDGDSAHNLRFFNAGAYIVHTKWSHAAYTDAAGATQIVDVPDDDTWRLEGVPLGSQWPFAAAYPHKNGNIAFFVARFDGILGGKPVSSYGLSCFGGRDWTELFLTAPGRIERLEAGDHIEAHLFVMPYGHEDSDHGPAERQRYLYGEKMAKLEVVHGTPTTGYPRRLRADERGFAEFTVADGDNWTPFIVEGFKSHRGFMLWERTNQGWLFHDQQILGNDWYQTYRASDGSIGVVLLVKLRPEMNHRYLVSAAPHARSITQRNGFVTLNGGPMDFISPVSFDGVECTPLEGTDLLRCSGNTEMATSR